LFSPIGVVGGLSAAFWPLIVSLLALNILIWFKQAFPAFMRYTGK